MINKNLLPQRNGAVSGSDPSAGDPAVHSRTKRASRSQIIDWLRGNHCFADFPVAILQAAAESVEVLRVPKGATVLSELQSSDAVFLIAKGTVGFFAARDGTDRDLEIGSVGEHGFFGESMVLETGNRRESGNPCRVRCQADSILLKLPGDIFRKLLPSEAKILTRNLLRHASGKTRTAGVHRMQRKVAGERGEMRASIGEWFCQYVSPLLGTSVLETSGLQDSAAGTPPQGIRDLVEELTAFAEMCDVRTSSCRLQTIPLREWWEAIGQDLRVNFEHPGLRLDAYVRDEEFLADAKMLDTSVRRLFRRASGLAMPGTTIDWRVGSIAGNMEFNLTFTQDQISDFLAENLFDPFSSPDVMRATGLDFAVAKRYFEIMGGSALIQSRSGHLLRIQLWLPHRKT